MKNKTTKRHEVLFARVSVQAKKLVDRVRRKRKYSSQAASVEACIIKGAEALLNDEQADISK